MRKAILITGLVLVTTIQGMAQDQDHRKGRRGEDRLSPVERIDKNLANMDKELDLTEDQEEAIRGILIKRQEEASALRSERKEAERGDREEVKEKLKAIHEETEQEILSVLNDDQDTKFLEMMEKRKMRAKEKMEKRRDRRGRG